ncbi:wd40 repeat [Trichoderma arundinaceum]|uniref:Wd40 repeat n=1 Tax=Trichoderma arundinaceum TaxID=490622 RepID=A0A395NY48_TRIAR|nr:wd40 repeat [Trichoderma arundinaceum]
MAETLGLVSSIASLIDLFIKVGVQCSLYCSGVKNAPRDIRQILNEADRFTATLKHLEQLLAGPNGAKLDSSQNICRSVADCRLQLDDLITKLERGTRLQRITWPLKKEDIIGILHRLQKYRAVIASDLQVDQTALLLDVHQEVVLAKLNSAKGAAFDSSSHVSNSKCYPGTRDDILQQILTWGTALDGQCVFWLNGGAGTGKSTISRTVAQMFADKGMLGASFFFKRGESDRGNMALFFPTIASQLVQTLPSIAPHIRAAVEANPAIHDKSIKDQFDKLIADPIKNASEHIHTRTIVLVVDALDECDNVEHVRLVIYLLSQAKHFASIRLKAFVTSRPELAIRLGFEDICGQYEDLVLHRIPRAIIEHDITLFLKHELTVIRRDYNKSVSSDRQLPPSWPDTDKFQKLVSMSVPLFIFAATACRFVQDRRIGGPKEQLAKILEHQTSHKSSLDATYLPIVEGLVAGLSASEKSQVAERFRQVVGSIVILASPLCTPSLARLFAMPLDVIEDQLDLLHSVLFVPSDRSTPVRLLHLSFRDFLVDKEKANELERYPFWVDEQEAHQRLATQCLQLLSTNDTLRRNICGLQLPSTPRSEIYQQTIDAVLPPEVQYACRYWVYHWKESMYKIKDGGLVERFLVNHLLHWLEALSLIGRISECIGMVHDLLGLLDLEQSSFTSKLLRDARRIILHYRSIIDYSPLQVYYSAIVFAPEQSIVRTQFRNELPAWLSLPAQVASEWDSCLQTLEGQTWVTSVAFSHDSNVIASASVEATIKLWDTVTGTCISTLEGHSSPVRSIAFSHDSKMLVSSSEFDENTIKIWDVMTGACRATIESYTDSKTSLRSVVFSHDSSSIASVSEYKLSYHIKLWDVTTCACIATYSGHSSGIYSIAFSHDSKMLASASSDKTIKLWNTVSGICTSTLEGHSSPVLSVAYSHDSTILASASEDASIKLWDAVTGACIATLKGHSKDVTSVAFSHDSRMLASASYDCDVRLWDVTKKTSIATLKGHTNWVNAVALSHNSKLLASAAGDSTIKIWDVEMDVGQMSSTGHSDFITSVKFVDNTNVLISASRDKIIRLWDVSTCACTATLKGCGDWVNLIAVSPNSKMLASPSASDDGTIHLWDITTSTRIATLEGHESLVRPDDPPHDPMLSMFESKGRRGILVWDPRRDCHRWVVGWNNSVISAVVFSHDSQQLASASAVDGIIRVWDVGTGACTAVLKGHSMWVNWLAFSHDSNILVSSSGDRSIKVWDIEMGICSTTLEGHSEYDACPIAFSHDYKMLASGADDGAIKLWDVSAALKFWDVSKGLCIAAVDTSYISKDYCVFATTGSSLSTSVGNFTLEGALSPRNTTAVASAVAPVGLEADLLPRKNTIMPATDVHIHRRGIGLSEDVSWVMWDEDKLIWLPPAYRPRKSAIRESTLALGCSRSKIVLLTIFPELIDFI